MEARLVGLERHKRVEVVLGFVNPRSPWVEGVRGDGFDWRSTLGCRLLAVDEVAEEIRNRLRKLDSQARHS